MENRDTKQAFRAAYLLSRQIAGDLTIDEQKELYLWLAERPENKQLFIALQDRVYRNSILNQWTPEAAESSLQNIKSKIRSAKRHRLWLGISIAASIVLVLWSALYFYVFRSPVVNQQPQIVMQHDVAPGKNAATLTLSDNSRVVLSAVSNGRLAEQAGVVISKTADGQVVYKAKATTGNQEIKYNILSTAKGKTYQIELPDGTKVWLNAATTLKFPPTFAGSVNREVELTGEAYFEVAKDKKHPFIVHSDEQDIQVLGTHFNVNAYHDEKAVETTLLEGLVRVTPYYVLQRVSGNRVINNVNHNAKIANLLPGQQSILTGNNIKIQSANLEETIAWKNGYFKFNDESLESIMRKLERWYDVEVAYEGKFENEGFSGKISRSRNISKVLKILESTKTVRFKVEGRRITVTK